jgi:hypothetical protein
LETRWLLHLQALKHPLMSTSGLTRSPASIADPRDYLTGSFRQTFLLSDHEAGDHTDFGLGRRSWEVGEEDCCLLREGDAHPGLQFNFPAQTSQCVDEKMKSLRANSGERVLYTVYHIPINLSVRTAIFLQQPVVLFIRHGTQTTPRFIQPRHIRHIQLTPTSRGELFDNMGNPRN